MSSTRTCVLSVLVYIAFYVCVVALSLPGAFILTATAGLLFGWLLGGLVAVVGATLGATVLFLVARSALGEGLTARAGPWLAKLRAGFKEDALSYLLFLRLVPAFPFWFVNIAPAILGVPLKTYVVATFFGIIPATFAFAAAGAGLDSVIMAAKAEYAECVALKVAEACKLSDSCKLARHQGTGVGACALGARRAHSRRRQEMEDHPCSSQMTARSA